MASLGKMLSSTGKTRGITGPAKPGVIKTNTVKGSPREGRQYIDVTDASGITVHRYGVEGDDVKWDASRKSAGPKMDSSSPAALSAKPKPRGGLVNQIKSSARYGKSYKVATKNGMTGHLYANGTFVPMGKAKS